MRPPSDKKAIVELIQKVSEIVQAYPLIHEIDLNPVIVHKEGLTIIDARIILSEDDVEKKKRLSISLDGSSS